jgi:transposase
LGAVNLFVLETGVRWRDLSTKLGFGSGSTCWRRLRDWHKAGVWKRLHELLLAKQKPKVIYADRGYDSEAHRQKLRERGIKPVIARRRTEHGSGLGKFRWVVERTHAWLHNFRRLRIRFERRA